MTSQLYNISNIYNEKRHKKIPIVMTCTIKQTSSILKPPSSLCTTNRNENNQYESVIDSQYDEIPLTPQKRPTKIACVNEIIQLLIDNTVEHI